jgi:hypothetical protein
MPVDLENKAFCPIPFDEVSQHLQGIAINRKGSHPAMLLFSSACFIHFVAADRTESVFFAQPCSAHRAVQIDASFKVQDGYSTSLKVDIFDTDSQGFRNPAAKPRQKPYEESISQASSLFFQLLQLIQAKIGFHS